MKNKGLTREGMVLAEFLAGLESHTLAKSIGCDLSGYFDGHKRMLSLYGITVMGTTLRPESWRQANVNKRYSPSVDKWENFFGGWLIAANNGKYEELLGLGIDLLEVHDPYADLLLSLIQLHYGKEAQKEVEAFVYENPSMIYYHENGTHQDLRHPRSFAEYFKLKYDTCYDQPDISISHN